MIVEKPMARCIIYIMKLINRLRFAALTMLLLGVSAGDAMAAKEKVPVLEGAVPTWAIVWTVVFFVCICIVAFKNARRTHMGD